MLPETNGLHVRDEQADDADEPASVTVSARVRDIITRNLATPDGDCTSAPAAEEPGSEHLAEQNKTLQVCSAFTGHVAAIIDTVRVVCGAGTMKRSSVRPSVCLSVPSIHGRCRRSAANAGIVVLIAAVEG